MRDNWLLRNFPATWGSTVYQSVADYDGSETLRISCTQLEDGNLQRRLVAEWCAFLPTAKTVRRLGFYSHTNQRLFDAACSVPRLDWLYVKWGNIKDISGLAHQSSLTYLDFSSCPSAAPASVIGELRHLEYLRLNHVRDAKNIGWIANLTKLRELDIGGSLWTTQTIDSLDPISHLSDLGLLMCSASNVLDKGSLRSLAILKELRELWLPHNWPKRDDIEYLLAEIPGLRVMDWPWD